MKISTLNVLCSFSLLFPLASFSKELAIPTKDGCSGKVVYSDSFIPALKRVDPDDFEKNHTDFAEVPSYFAGTLKLTSHSFNVYYNLGPSCDPSFLIENLEKKLFEFSGETLFVKNGTLALKQKFNTCFEITRKLTIDGNTVKQAPKSVYDVNKAGRLTKEVNLFSDEDLQKKLRTLSSGSKVMVVGYLPSWDFHENKPNRVQVRLDDGVMGWLELKPEGPEQKTQVDFMRCWGD